MRVVAGVDSDSVEGLPAAVGDTAKRSPESGIGKGCCDGATALEGDLGGLLDDMHDVQK